MRTLLLVALSLCFAATAFGQTVLVEYKTKHVTVQTKLLPDGKKEITTTDYGLSDVEYQLLDLIMERLKEKGIKATSDESDKITHVVRIHLAYFASGSSIDFSIKVEFGKSLSSAASHWRLFNGNRSCGYFMSDFSMDIANYIADLVKKFP